MELKRVQAQLAESQKAAAEAQRKTAEALNAKIAAGTGETPGMVALTYQQLQDLMSGQTELVKEVIVELRKKDPEEQKKLDDAKARADERKRVRILEIQTREEQRRIAWANCNHMNEHGRTTIWKGQVFKDGFYHPFCHRCQKPSEPIPASMADYATG